MPVLLLHLKPNYYSWAAVPQSVMLYTQLYLVCFSYAVVEVADRDRTVQTNSPLYVVESLLQALTNYDKDGRVIINFSKRFAGGGDSANHSGNSGMSPVT